ncbi:hypothetical protein Bbelb_427880 [Branchiostoma belcheri]|nr:hypothetical protein Bbelb_427880 [Branchiostoma belcheri]
MEVMEVTSDDIAGPKLIRNTTPSVVAGSVGQGPAREATASPTVNEPANPTASTKHAGRANDSRASIKPSTSNHTAGKCASLRKLLISSSLPIHTQEHSSARHTGPSDANDVASPTQPLETAPIDCNQHVNNRESAASLEMQPLCSNTLPAHVTEADKPSKPRGVTKELLGVRVTSDGRIGTMESAAATTLVKTTQSTAQSTSNGRKVIGVTTQHRPVPEPRGDTGNTAELVQATIATNTTIGVTAFGPPRYVPTGVAQKRHASPPLHHLNEVQTFSGNVSPSPSNAAASGPPHYNPTGAVPPLHCGHDVQTFSANVDELTSSSIPNNFGAPNVGIPAGFVTRKRKGSPLEEMANVPSKRKSPCELIGNYAVQQQQGQGKKFCQEGLSSHSVCSPSTNTGHVRQAVGPTQGVISDAIYEKIDVRRLKLAWESCGPVDGVPRDKAQEKFPVVIVFEQMKVALTSDFVSLFPHVTLTDFMKAVGGIGLKICPCPASVKEWFMQVGKEEAACSTVVKLGFESVSFFALLLSKQFSQQRCTSSNENTFIAIGNNITNATAENIRVSSTGHANCYRRSNDRHQMSTPPYGSEPNVNNPPAVPRSAVRAPPSPLVLESPEDSSSGLQIVAVQSLATGEGYSMVGNQQRVSTEGMPGSVQRDTARMESVQGPYQHPVSSSSQQPYYPPPPPAAPVTFQSNNSGVPIANLQTWSQVRTVEYWQQHATERNHQPSTVPGLAYLPHATYTGLRTSWNH